MYPSFLPPLVNQLTELDAIRLAQQLQQVAIATPLQTDPILTSFVQQGSGDQDILLIHGFDSSVLEYRYLLPKLAQQHPVWAVDLLSFGFTERPEQLPFTPETIKTHLYQFWQQQINRPVVIVGASMGGAVALDFALSYPDAVKQIVLLDSAGLAPKPLSRFAMVPPLDRWATQFLGSMNIRRKICQSAYFDKTKVTTDAVLCGAMHVQCDRWQEALIQFTKGGGYGSFYPKLKQIQQPTLILWGEQDRILGTKAAHRFQQGLPNSTLHWIPNCGHLPHVEQTTLVAEHILRFCQTLIPITSNH
ncbi:MULTISPECIES: alpha/beta fold hydrolase [Cyanophyceae]|uniref:alpha/beta fold hydrolase n=1 Tax=Cyanophyceae TaxID=3028117 RepID=UPI000810EC2A|nr:MULTISPECIES: alpha/beta hydrolase [Cyanophyceae]ANV86775.1 2-hydroxy-6-oxohepta-2,4-dienoate hydrolase [Picosynechococcus sp. PCC 7117]